MSVYTRPRMPMRTVQIWRISTVARPTSKHTGSAHVPPDAMENTVASACMPRMTHGRMATTPMMDVTTPTAFEP